MDASYIDVDNDIDNAHASAREFNNSVLHARIRARPPSAWPYDPHDPTGELHGVDWLRMQSA